MENKETQMDAIENENRNMSLYDFLGYIAFDMHVKIMDKENIRYEGTVEEVPFAVINQAIVEENSAYLDHEVLVIPVIFAAEQ